MFDYHYGGIKRLKAGVKAQQEFWTRGLLRRRSWPEGILSGRIRILKVAVF